MKIGPRSEEEAALNEKFGREADKFSKKFTKEDVEILIVARRGDGLMLHANGVCVHVCIELLEIALDKLAAVADAQDKSQAKLN